MKYQLTNADVVRRIKDSGIVSCIPFDPDNSDYQAFLAWKAEGNEPLPADEGEQA